MAKPQDQRSLKRFGVIVLLGVSLIPLAEFFYWLPYALTGRAKYAFYEFGGYFIFWYIVPAIGIGALILFLSICSAAKFRRIGIAYAAVLILMFFGFLIFGMLD